MKLLEQPSGSCLSLLAAGIWNPGLRLVDQVFGLSHRGFGLLPLRMFPVNALFSKACSEREAVSDKLLHRGWGRSLHGTSPHPRLYASPSLSISR